jgi:serine/threonine protein kinase
MIVKAQVRSKSNLQASTPQSKKTTSTISLKFNSWLTRFNMQPKVEIEAEKKDFFSHPSECKLDIPILRDSPPPMERARPHSKPIKKNTTISYSPKKTPSRPSVKNENSSRVPSQLINKIQAKIEKPQSPSRSEPLSEYTIGNTLGTGSYGVVKYGVHKATDRKVAIKIYDKSKMTDINQQKSVQTEIKILLKLDHPNIVKLYQHIDTNKYIYIILEYISGHSLSTSLKRKPTRRLEEFEANKYFHELLQALDYCHSKGITHRDIKLENTLIDNANKRVKLIDFGFATCFSNLKKVKLFCGTPSYMAPEIVSRKEYCGPPVDIWAAGVLLYVLLTGSFPFKGNSDSELYKNILKGHLVFPDYLSIAAKQLISKMLSLDPTKRPRAADLIKDPWFRSSSAFSISTSISKPERMSEDRFIKVDNSPKYKLLSSSFNSLDLHICSAGEKVPKFE